jgi:hypothetical protein
LTVKFLALVGFGCSGNTAISDALLESSRFKAYCDYEEINELRKGNGLIEMFSRYQVSKRKRRLILSFIFKSILEFVRLFIWGCRHTLFTDSKLSFRRRVENLFKRTRCQLHTIRTVLSFSRFSSKDSILNLIRYYIEGLRFACRVQTNQIFILNLISLPEYLTTELLLAFPNNLKVVYSTRDALDSFCDIESNESHFGPGNLAHEFLLGRDPKGLMRRKNFIDVSRYRVEISSQNIDQFPNRILVQNFKRMVNDFPSSLAGLLEFCGLTEREFSDSRLDTLERTFDPELSAKNIRTHAIKIEILSDLGYTETMFSDLDKLTKSYDRLEEQCEYTSKVIT